jgi:hypothetical protein
MSILELKGCGVLSKASINCPRLTSLDASFCRLCHFQFFIYFFIYAINCYLCSLYFCMFRQLVDDSLTCMSEACPMIEHLILSSCLSIGIDGLSSLHCLHKLTLLDLSYTFLDNLKPVFNSCLQLKVSLTVPVFNAYVADFGIQCIKMEPYFSSCYSMQIYSAAYVYAYVHVCNAIKCFSIFFHFM